MAAMTLANMRSHGVRHILLFCTVRIPIPGELGANGHQNHRSHRVLSLTKPTVKAG